MGANVYINLINFINALSNDVTGLSWRFGRAVARFEKVKVRLEENYCMRGG